MKSPTCVKEIQMLNGRLTTVNQIISSSTDKCKPFFQALKKNGADFRWNEECETSFLGAEEVLDLTTLTVAAFLGRYVVSLPLRLGISG